MKKHKNNSLMVMRLSILLLTIFALSYIPAIIKGDLLSIALFAVFGAIIYFSILAYRDMVRMDKEYEEKMKEAKEVEKKIKEHFITLLNIPPEGPPSSTEKHKWN